jgi:diguanylate cyclase (GGDEF)-like protein
LARKYPPSLPQRFLVTEEVIKQASLSHTPHMPQVLIMIEIDRFQEMQEVYSEDTLAQMLDTVSSLLQSLVRKQDFLLPQAKARYLLILPRTSQRAAIAMAETIRKEVEAQTFPAEPFPIPITLSLGLIAFDADPKRSIYDQFDAFLGKVDRALAKAKEKGNTLIAIKKRDSS